MEAFKPELTKEEMAEISAEFKRVGDNTYLDHAGTTLYSEKMMDDVGSLLKNNLFCNPHTCNMTGDLLDQVRYKILQFFNTDATEYAVVFTANATAALKLVAETFDFGNNGSFYYCQQNHTSVLGMRELVKTERQFVLTTTELLKNSFIAEQKQLAEQQHKGSNSLLVFPAQCNFSGYKMPLNIISKIHEHGLSERGKQTYGEIDAAGRDESEFYVCLDAASLVATSFLDLQKYEPDFCCISFYKIFGYPTGVGALLVSKRGQAVLRKRFYGGGTVEIAMSRQNFHAKRSNFTSRFEDGTLPFLAIAALLEGFRTIERLIPATPSKRSIERISAHVFALAKFCHNQLTSLKHGNGAPLVEFYAQAGYEQQHLQGGIVAFNMLHADGSYIGFAEVACLAASHNIQLRTGCFCNPGACQWFLQMSDQTVRAQYAAGHICSDYNDLVDGLPTGAVRVSFGYMSTLEHIYRLVKMLRSCFLESTSIERLKLLENSNVSAALQSVAQRLKPQLKQICVYPVKSCGAFSVKSWPVSENGLKYDRNWIIVDANGVAVTQKQHARLCLIMPHIDLELGLLQLSFPGHTKISLPLNIEDANLKTVASSLCRSKVCNDLIEGVNCGDTVTNWLSSCLEVEGLRLLQKTSDRRRLDGTTKDISFVNQAQFLLINRASVRWLLSKVKTEQEPLERAVARFRANLIIETSTAMEENNLDYLNIGGIEFKIDSFCTRCQMICIDQQSGQRTAEPLRTIAREFNGKIRFGIYLSLEKNIIQDTILSCDDRIEMKLKETSNMLHMTGEP